MACEADEVVDIADFRWLCARKIADSNCQHHEDVIDLAAVDQQLEEDTIFCTAFI